MKILILHASAGAGHQKAAEAIFDGFKNETTHQVFCEDALKFTPVFYKNSYQKTYTFLITWLPWLWGAFFALIDIPVLQPLIKGLRRLQNALAGKSLERFLIEEHFDVIIVTHFFPQEVTAALKRRGLISSRIVCVVTDYDVHRIWLAAGTDHYTVACERTREKLISLGVGEDKILVSGIPVHEKFIQQPEISVLKGRLGLKEDYFTVLVATGSFGIGPIEEILRNLKGVQALVVCGHNKNLFSRLQNVRSGLIKIFGLVNNMEELMAVADVMITKPGGLSISEALVRHLPLIFFNAIPGQETNNIQVLAYYGIGQRCATPPEIAQAVERLKNSKDLFMTTVKKTQALARPQAVREIIALIQE